MVCLKLLRKNDNTLKDKLTVSFRNPKPYSSFIMVDSSWIFHSQLSLTLFSSFFFLANYCDLLSFLKNHKIVMSLIISNLFYHKYNDKNFSKGNKKQGSLRNQFPRKTNFPAKPVSPRNQFPCKTSFLAKPFSFYVWFLLKYSEKVFFFSSKTHFW